MIKNINIMEYIIYKMLLNIKYIKTELIKKIKLKLKFLKNERNSIMLIV